ncbi:MAG: CbiX/SirB N-terminal domain-containing protein [Candidatus Margulisbacteria bacterium]|nr:CbiX/SirB N-terminal domain-containing protein [Candidatus Margulisiibacteriota bacterium]
MVHDSCLIIIVHGSRDPRWRHPFEVFVSSLKKELQTEAVFLSYMEICHPTLLEASTSATEMGYKHINVIPFFMSGGGHVDNDIPRLVNEVKEKRPHITITQLPPIGEHPTVQAAMKDVAKKTLTHE